MLYRATYDNRWRSRHYHHLPKPRRQQMQRPGARAVEIHSLRCCLWTTSCTYAEDAGARKCNLVNQVSPILHACLSLLFHLPCEDAQYLSQPQQGHVAALRSLMGWIQPYVCASFLTSTVLPPPNADVLRNGSHRAEDAKPKLYTLSVDTASLCKFHSDSRVQN